MFIKTAQAIVQEDIANLERITGHKLPKEFASQYLTFNGGVPDKALFCDAEDEEDGYEISFYLPVKYYSDDLGEMKIEKSYAKLTSVNVPLHYLPFAVDWGGNYFAIHLKTEEVVLLLMDLGEFTEDCIEYLAPNYSEFVENLIEAKD